MSAPDQEWTRAMWAHHQSDIRWAKERASNVAHWSVAIAGGVVATTRVADLPVWLPVTFAIVQAGIAVLWLRDLDSFAKASRESAATFLPYTSAEPKLPQADRHHSNIKWSQIALCVLATLVAIAAIVSPAA